MINRLLAIIAFVLFAPAIHAQPWMKGRENQPVKLQDVIDEYRKNPSTYQEEDEERALEMSNSKSEKKNYHFDRWVWYMQQHTDTEGYLVSPAKTYQEWASYMQAYRLRNELSKGTGTVSNWTFHGPTAGQGGNSGVGRIQTMAFHPTDSNTYWVGAAGGGAWKTTNNGQTWTCMTDMLPVLGAAEIVYNPLNPQVMYLCTGDRDAGDNYSIGVLKSTDGGSTWNSTGFMWTVQQQRTTNSLVINPFDTSSLLLATSAGIYKTNNSGATWSLVQSGNFKQIMYRPQDSMVAYAAGMGGNSWGIYRTGNGGQTWTTSMTSAGSTRIAIAVSPAARNSVQAVVSNSSYGLDGIYKSTDTGKTFTAIYTDVNCTKNILNSSITLSTTSCGGQGWYDLAIAISPTDSNKMFVGGVNSWQSNNGGVSWSLLNQWYGSGTQLIHADKHFLKFHPLSPGTLFEGNDGGVYKTNSSLIFSNITTGLGITQFYRNAVSNNTTFVLGGAQDNGSKRVNFSGTTVQQIGADGMNCEIDYSNANTYYCASQYGSIQRTTNGGGNFSSISNNIPSQPQGDWITPYLVHATVPTTIFAGYNRVYRSLNRGTSWVAISPTFYTNQNITRLALTVADTGTIYAIVANQIRSSYNSGVDWTALMVPYNGLISDIAVSHKNAQNIWVTFSGYGTTKVVEYDTATGWHNHSTGLPNVPVNCMVIDTAMNIKYIGTDVGVFYLDSLDTWQLYSTNLPAAEVRDLGINYTTDEIWAATYGRGMWSSAKRTYQIVTTPNGISTIPYAMDVITVAPNPAEDGHFTISTSNKALVGHNADVRLFDMSGRTAWNKALPFDADGRMEVSTAGLNRGTYMVQVTGTNGFVAKTKVIVM